MIRNREVAKQRGRSAARQPNRVAALYNVRIMHSKFEILWSAIAYRLKMKIFKCYLCFSEFNEQSSALDHLKKLHGVKEKHQPIKCITKNTKCTKTFQTWSGLKNHLKVCAKTVKKVKTFV